MSTFKPNPIRDNFLYVLKIIFPISYSHRRHNWQVDKTSRCFIMTFSSWWQLLSRLSMRLCDSCKKSISGSLIKTTWLLIEESLNQIYSAESSGNKILCYSLLYTTQINSGNTPSVVFPVRLIDSLIKMCLWKGDFACQLYSAPPFTNLS